MRFTHRGLSAHKFTPMPGVHNVLHGSCGRHPLSNNVTGRNSVITVVMPREPMHREVENAIAARMLASLTHELSHTFQLIRLIASEGRHGHRDANELFDEIGRIAESGHRLLHQCRTFQKEGRPRKQQHSSRAIRDAIERLIRSERSSRIALESAPTKNATVVNVDLHLLTEAFQILLSNALEHGDSTSRVVIRIANTDDKLSVEFENKAKSPHGDFEQWLQPFWTTSPNGIGLGLAVAAAIVQQMDGTLVGMIADTEVRVTIDLPVSASELP